MSVKRSKASLLCISLGESNIQKLLKQLERAAQWADLIEIRLDQLLAFDVKFISLIESVVTSPIIWTLRKVSQGGISRVQRKSDSIFYLNLSKIFVRLLST